MESSELLSILEQLERDKGIEKEILIEAVEFAVASAARKLWTVDKNEEIEVVLDPKTGKLKAFADGQEIRSGEFGRIAAQTAKQVVIQKIREAEKDVVFNEYFARVGQIISGSVYRFERGTIIVDLGKTEAQIPKKEQSPKEEFKQGDRIRVYVLAVEKDARGPQIILSRAHPNFIKRLFELEVPEIYEGIVEVKSISRDVGERTKIAVFSKDEKVDCVGACVGMRGSRVKNIVSELHGEKIDIVRYADDIKEYIQAALAPAEISQMQLDYEGKKVNIIVADDQLSLAIGKHGQNVRLASELVGWELNLFSFDQWSALQEEDEAEEAEEAANEETAADEDTTAADEEALEEEAAAQGSPEEESSLKEDEGEDIEEKIQDEENVSEEPEPVVEEPAEEEIAAEADVETPEESAEEVAVEAEEAVEQEPAEEQPDAEEEPKKDVTDEPVGDEDTTPSAPDDESSEGQEEDKTSH